MEDNEISLTDAQDSAIIMHRDAHFGGNFSLMIDYYEKGGKGVNDEFDLERIKELTLLEKEMNQNLAGTLLTGPDAEKVAQAREAYKTLRDLYENESPYSKYPKLLADLILSEEEEPEEEIQAIVKEKGAIVKALVDLVHAEEFHDPLFPGYGKAPALAAKCLGLIGDKKGIVTLFEALNGEDFFDEEIALKALRAIGSPAKEFLLKVLHARPITVDNERAALALIQFKEDSEVQNIALEMLKDPLVRKNPLLAIYIALIFEGISDPGQQKEFKQLITDPATPSQLRKEMEMVAKSFVQ